MSEATFWGLEKSKALICMAFWPFGPQNRHFCPMTTTREKRQDWLAEEPVTSELLSATKNRGKYREKCAQRRSLFAHKDRILLSGLQL